MSAYEIEPRPNVWESIFCIYPPFFFFAFFFFFLVLYLGSLGVSEKQVLPTSFFDFDSKILIFEASKVFLACFRPVSLRLAKMVETK